MQITFGDGLPNLMSFAHRRNIWVTANITSRFLHVTYASYSEVQEVVIADEDITQNVELCVASDISNFNGSVETMKVIEVEILRSLS